MPPRHWDIFCRVVDNFGDIGVSWRLAQQLVQEHGATVRLWVDKLDALHALCPDADASAPSQRVQGVAVHQYDVVLPSSADVVIEAFGCGLPPHYVVQMAAREVKPLWIILEYLSAEAWVSEHHGLPSPHPQLDLPRYFFFPGVLPGTGGVLREVDVLCRREAFDADAHARRAWWARYGFEAVPPQVLTVLLFAYPHAPWRALLAVCEAGDEPVVVAIPEGVLAQQVRNTYCTGDAKRFHSGQLELRFMPFVPQADFDTLLWACDVNFVRGEDSFVRAQWAGRPFVWHIYPQQQRVHEQKLQAFLDAYGSVFSGEAAAEVRRLWLAWNAVTGAPAMASAWHGFLATRQAQALALRQWQAHLIQSGDMAGNLLRFCQKLIQSKAL